MCNFTGDSILKLFQLQIVSVYQADVCPLGELAPPPSHDAKSSNSDNAWEVFKSSFSSLVFALPPGEAEIFVQGLGCAVCVCWMQKSPSRGWLTSVDISRSWRSVVRGTGHHRAKVIKCPKLQVVGWKNEGILHYLRLSLSSSISMQLLF